MFTFIIINWTVPENINFDKDGNLVICTNIFRVIPVTVLIGPSNFLHEQLRKIEMLAQAMDLWTTGIFPNPYLFPNVGQGS